MAILGSLVILVPAVLLVTVENQVTLVPLVLAVTQVLVEKAGIQE